MAVTLSGGPSYQNLSFLERQTRSLRGQALLAQKEVTSLMNSVARQAASRLFTAAYKCPLHEHRAGPSEGPEVCLTCHPDVPLITDTQPLHASCLEAIRALTFSHLAEMVESEAFYTRPSDDLVPLRLDWAEPAQRAAPRSPVRAVGSAPDPVTPPSPPSEGEEERPALAPLLQPTTSPSSWTVGEGV